MFRLAIYYDSDCSGRNDGNPLYVFSALKRMEKKGLLEVDHIIPRGDIAQYGTYDAHLWVDWGEDGLGSLINYKILDCPKPNIYWASDTHIHEASYKYRLETARKFDHVFVAQKRALEEFERDGVKAEWLPHAFEPLAYCDPDTGKPFLFASKKYDVCFIGHINSENRINALDDLFHAFHSEIGERQKFFYGQRLFNEAAEKYAESKICFNISMTDDINMRCFEIMGSKSCLLTNWLPTIEELGFQDGKNCLLYKDMKEAIEKARYYVEHDEEREKIAEEGHRFVMENHTIDHRVGKILEAVEKLNLVGV